MRNVSATAGVHVHVKYLLKNKFHPIIHLKESNEKWKCTIFVILMTFGDYCGYSGLNTDNSHGIFFFIYIYKAV